MSSPSVGYRELLGLRAALQYDDRLAGKAGKFLDCTGIADNNVASALIVTPYEVDDFDLDYSLPQ